MCKAAISRDSIFEVPQIDLPIFTLTTGFLTLGYTAVNIFICGKERVSGPSLAAISGFKT
jgi:hypothetical protein